MKYCGVIYKITNLINNKIYIGQTTQKVEKRIRYHFSTKADTAISRAVQKYGSNSFKYEVIITTFTRIDLDNLEVYFIKEFNTLRPNGYNISGGGQGERLMSEETKKKISLIKKEYYKTNISWAKGKKFTKQHCESLSKVRKGFTSEARQQSARKSAQLYCKPVKVINIQTNEQFIFNSTMEAANVLNLTASCISRCCRGDQNRTQHKGYTFRYINQQECHPLPLKDDSLKGISLLNNKFIVVIKGEYLGSFMTLEYAKEAKRLHSINKIDYNNYINKLIKNKELLVWQKRQPKV